MNGIDTVFIVLKRMQKDGSVVRDRNRAPPHMIALKVARYTTFEKGKHSGKTHLKMNGIDTVFIVLKRIQKDARVMRD